MQAVLGWQFTNYSDILKVLAHLNKIDSETKALLIRLDDIKDEQIIDDRITDYMVNYINQNKFKDDKMRIYEYEDNYGYWQNICVGFVIPCETYKKGYQNPTSTISLSEVEKVLRENAQVINIISKLFDSEPKIIQQDVEYYRHR